MKSIGLFGDSFTGDNTYSSQKYHWSTLLSQHIGCELKNYGAAGSSIYFSYKQFLENYHKHDLIIFLITAPGRYIKPITLYSGKDIHISSLTALESSDNKEWYSHVPDDLRGWFMCSDDIYHNDMTYLMLAKMHTLSTNIIFIPCFVSLLSDQIKEKFFEKNVIHMFELQKFQAKLYGTFAPKLISTHSENNSIISGHFVPEINELVYSKILNRIKTGFWEENILKYIKLSFSFNEAFKIRGNNESNIME